MKRIYLLLPTVFSIQIIIGQINSSYKWTWVSGSNGYNAPGVYGQKGAENTTNQPGGRYDFASWLDLNGNFWIFGGYGRATLSAAGWLNDLWRFNPNNNQWTWIAGDSLINQPAFQSGIGVSSPDNTPSARSASIYWTSSDGIELYLYGGASNQNAGDDEIFGDVWAYNVVSGMWRILKYAILDSAGNCSGQNNGGVDEFTPGVWPVCRAAATSSGASGKAFVFGGSNGNFGHNLSSEFYMFYDYNSFQPQNNQWAAIQFGAEYSNSQPGYYRGSFPHPGSRRDANSFSYFNGVQDKFYLFGGNGHGALVNGVSNEGELNDLWRYDGRNTLTGSPIWTWLKGDSTLNSAGKYGTQGVAAADNNPPARSYSSMKNAGGNQAILFGGSNHTGGNLNLLNDLWTYDAASNMWTWINGSSSVGDGGNYGFKGTQSNINRISAREGAVMWISNGNVYLFGGCCDLKNDLWKFSPQEEPDPVNDEPCGAIELTLDAAPQYGNTAFATSTNDIPGICYGATNTVWYKYTPTTSGFVQFTLGGGLSGDTLNSWVGVFVPSSGTCPTLSLADSTLTTFHQCRSYFPSFGGFKTSSVWSNFLSAGKTYYFRISGIFADIGRYSFSLQSTNITTIASGNWNDPAIWSNNKVPTLESNVTVTFPITVNANAICKSLTITNHAQVTVQSHVTLTVLKQ